MLSTLRWQLRTASYLRHNGRPHLPTADLFRPAHGNHHGSLLRAQSQLLNALRPPTRKSRHQSHLRLLASAHPVKRGNHPLHMATQHLHPPGGSLPSRQVPPQRQRGRSALLSLLAHQPHRQFTASSCSRHVARSPTHRPRSDENGSRTRSHQGPPKFAGNNPSSLLRMLSTRISTRPPPQPTALRASPESGRANLLRHRGSLPSSDRWLHILSPLHRRLLPLHVHLPDEEERRSPRMDRATLRGFQHHRQSWPLIQPPRGHHPKSALRQTAANSSPAASSKYATNPPPPAHSPPHTSTNSTEWRSEP